MFTEDLSLFTDTAGFAVTATLAGVEVSVLMDAPGAVVLDGQVQTTQPSCLVEAGAGAAGDSLVIAAGDLTPASAHLAGSYTVRSVDPEPPDGAFDRLSLQGPV